MCRKPRAPEPFCQVHSRKGICVDAVCTRTAERALLSGSVRSDKSAQVVDVPVSSLPVVIDHLLLGCSLGVIFPSLI